MNKTEKIQPPLRGRALALAALDYIERHPEEWNQRIFRCRTGCCFAGHVMLLGGAKWLNPVEESQFAQSESVVYFDDEGKRVISFVDTVANGFLGFGYTSKKMHPLFNASNDLEDLRRFVDAIDFSSLKGKDS